MPFIVPYIASYLVEIGVSEVVATAIAEVIVTVAVTAAISSVEKALAPSPKSGIGASLESNYYSSEASVRVIYGLVRVGGMQTIPPITYGLNGEYLAGALTLAGHECDSINDAYFDSNNIPSASIGAVTGSLNDGLVSSGTYANKAWIRKYLGTLTQTVDFILHAAVSPTVFTADFRGRGITYVATQLKFDASVYPSVPQQTYDVKGKKCYDPRLDSTQPGGSGSQRAATPSTWTFSTNPALCTSDYLMANFGGSYDPADIDWPSVMVAANVCDFVLTGPFATDLGNQKRYTCNGAFLVSQGGGGQPFTDNITLLITAMLGKIVYANGVWKMYAGAWQTPNAVPINRNDWISGLQISFEQGRAKRFNMAHCWFIDPNQNWQRVECYPRRNTTYQTADGGELIEFETDQPFCTVEREAQRKAEFLLRQSRNQVTVAGKLGPKFQGLQLWDTVYVNYDTFGWSSKTFRVAGITLNPDGSVDVSLSEEQASDWADLLTAEYNAIDTIPVPTTSGTIPSSPLNFAVKVVNGTVSFDWDPGQVIPKGTHYQILSAANSLDTLSNKTVLWQGDATQATLNFNNNAPIYVQVQAFANSDFSPYNPNTYGLQVVPNYSDVVVTSAWVARLSGSQVKSGKGPSLGLGLTAVVQSPSAAVYSWSLTGGSGVTLTSNPGSAFATFQTSLGPGGHSNASFNCAISDPPNGATLSGNLTFLAQAS